MRNVMRLMLALGLAGAIASCSTTNVSQSPTPDWKGAAAFSVSMLEGSGMFDPVLSIQEDTAGATVVVNAENAASVSTAYVSVNYDASRYTPAKVEFGDFLGVSGEYISLAVTDKAGEIPMGLAQVKSTGVLPVRGSGVLATIRFNRGAYSGRSVSKTATSPANAVEDLQILNQTSTSADLQWTEKHVGDYDNNGEASVSDLTPLAALLGQTSDTAPDLDQFNLVDGDGNGEINVSDLTPLAAAFGSVVSGYILYVDEGGTDPFGSGITVLRTDQNVVKNRPVVYSYTALFNPGSSPLFSVRPADESEIDNPGPQSNLAEIVVQDGPPLAPTNLQVLSSQIVGPGKLKLTWGLSTSTDVAKYEIERKLTSEDDTAWVSILTEDQWPSGTTNTYTDSGLTEQSYDYRVWSKDNSGLMSAASSNIGSNTPYIVVVSPAENVSAISGGGPHSVTFKFDKPADGSAMRYQMFRKLPADIDFQPLQGMGTFVANTVTYVDGDGAAGDTIEYYVICYDTSGTVASVPSPTVSAQASPDAPPISITDLTTSKWTHLQSGGETAATLTVTTDVPADTVQWSASVGGNPSGSGNTATWSPSGNPPLGKVTITCTVTNVSGSDNATIDLIVTDMPIKTNLGNQGRPPDFSGSYLDAIANGGNIANSSFYAETAENVCLVKEWESW